MIFLSYASEDRARIEPIRYALAEQGHDIFYDREDLKPGDAYETRAFGRPSSAATSSSAS